MNPDDVKSALEDFASVNTDLNVTSIEVEVLPAPHEPGGLPTGKQAVYCFAVPARWLKIGVAGPKSNARYRSQHYKAGRSMSSLAWSILQHPELLATVLGPEARRSVASIDWETVPDWIKAHTTRTNILLDGGVPRRTVRDLESYLHHRLRPLFEGRVTGGTGAE